MATKTKDQLSSTKSVKDDLRILTEFDGGRTIGQTIRESGGAEGFAHATAAVNNRINATPIADGGSGGMASGAASGLPMLENPELADAMSDPNAPWLSNKPFRRGMKIENSVNTGETMSTAERIYAGLKEWVSQRRINPKKIIPEDLREYFKLLELREDGVRGIMTGAGMKEGQVVMSTQITEVVTEVADNYDSLVKPRLTESDGSLGADYSADPAGAVLEGFSRLTAGDQAKVVEGISAMYRNRKEA